MGRPLRLMSGNPCTFHLAEWSPSQLRRSNRNPQIKMVTGRPLRLKSSDPCTSHQDLPPGGVEPIACQALAPSEESCFGFCNADRVIQEIAEEETNLYEEVQRNPERFQNDVNSEERAAATFQALTTRYGRVYHYQSRRRYLLSHQTGAIRESNWSIPSLFAHVGGRPQVSYYGSITGVEIITFHPRCPGRDPEKAFPSCQGCGESAPAKSFSIGAA